ncbi:hypothetical protein ZWY2020_008092 [Hordeum vulgare]|nr:hypothetical protein ZWY2020_008092 [Hordeum vulgare]
MSAASMRQQCSVRWPAVTTVRATQAPSRRDSEQRHSIRGCMDLVMLEHGNEEHHLRHDISSIQVTFLPEDFLPCC